MNINFNDRLTLHDESDTLRFILSLWYASNSAKNLFTTSISPISSESLDNFDFRLCKNLYSSTANK